MAIDVIEISEEEVQKILAINEGHFSDLKAIEIKPSKLTQSMSAFSNADGGEIFIGVDETKDTRTWRGFSNIEAANGHIQAFEALFPLGDGYLYSFLSSPKSNGYVLKLELSKSREIRAASNGKVYVRRAAQNLPLKLDEEITRLKQAKGISSFETETVAADLSIITNSRQIIEFMLEVIPFTEPENWLRKQQLIRGDNPTVAGLVLYADEPQAILPKRCGIKLYQYKMKEEVETRETLVFDPISIEGSAYSQIHEAVVKVTEIIESIRIMTTEGLKPAQYPQEALHEIITNAVLHRDYSIADDIHIRIFDNRVDVLSPGTLPAHITPENILEERFSRNGVIVRLINKFPNPPNKDVGEGLNTAFSAMKRMNLREPEISVAGQYVLVRLKHELLGSPQELILKYLTSHTFIANKEVREITNIKSENAVKHILKRMVTAGELQVVTGKTVFDTKYQLPNKTKG